MSNPYSPESTKDQLEHCRFCPKLCRHTCPVSNADAKEQHTPQSKMKQLHLLVNGEVPWTEEETEPLWACTGCRQCTTACDHQNEPGLVLLAGRKRAIEKGVHHPSLKNYPERFTERQERLEGSLSETSLKIQPQKSPVGFFPGCDMVDKSTKDIHSLFATLEKGDVSPPTLMAEGAVCGGYPLWAGGFEKEFLKHAERVKQSFDAYDKVVVNCSACYHTVTSVYPTMGLGVESKVLPLSSFLANASKSFKENTGEGELPTVYYHDPCYLARYQGVLEEPRRVLASVAKLKDFNYSHTETECCGGAGLLPKTSPKTSDSMAKHRMKEISESGGGDIVTSCGTCAFMLKSNATENVTVYDLPGYLATRLLKDKKS